MKKCWPRRCAEDYSRRGGAGKSDRPVSLQQAAKEKEQADRLTSPEWWVGLTAILKKHYNF
jgi:hypothetical protein